MFIQFISWMRERERNLNVYVKCAFVYIGAKREGQRKKKVEDKFKNVIMLKG